MAQGFSCSSNVFHEGLGIINLNFDEKNDDFDSFKIIGVSELQHRGDGNQHKRKTLIYVFL
jgi:hypothetical protein